MSLTFNLTKTPTNNITKYILCILIAFCLTVNKISAFDYYEELANATVIIKVNRGKDTNSMGSGVLLNSQGHILTCKHVVKNACTIKVMFRDTRDTYFVAKVIKTAKISDLAILEVLSYDNKPRPTVRPSFDLKLGDDMYAIGHPEAHYWSITRGIASNWFMTKDLEELIQTDVPLTFGNSGGGVYNNKGELVGIAHALFNPFPKKLKNKIGNTGIAYVIPISEIIRFYLE